MTKPTEYLLTRKIVRMIEQANLSLHQLRLVHACLAYVDRIKHLNIQMLALPTGEGCRASCADLAAITGSPGQKSATWVAETAKAGGLNKFFRECAAEEDGRLLRFKFSPNLGTAAIRNEEDAFVMLDSDEIATISSAPEFLFYVSSVMVAGANQPQFYIPLAGAPWTDRSKKGWLRVAARVSGRTGHEYLIVPQRDPVTRKIDQVRVKVTTSSSKWSAGCLYPRSPCPAVSVAHGGAYTCLKKADLKSRHAWTQVTCP